LQLLGTNQVILRAPPASHRTWGHLSSLEKINMGLHESKYREHFKFLIKEIDGAITRYGLKATWYKKLWHESKEFGVNP